MRTQNLAAILLVVVAIASGLVQAQTVNRSRPSMNPAVRSAVTPAVRPAENPTEKKAVLTAPVITALPRAPDLVGLSLGDAYSALSRLGLGRKDAYVDTTDDSVLYNHVGATIPAAGQVVTDGVVVVQIPRPASRTFAGALSLIDVVRRDGFDLDEGRYEQIFRGADMVLREDKTSIPHYEPVNGSTYYTTKGLFVEPSDGAAFAVPGVYGISTDQFPGGLGSAPNYFACSQALAASRTAYLNLPRADSYGKDLVFCALTSNRQIAVVQFRHSDMTCCGKDNYKFYIAVFPLQKSQGLRTRKAILAPVQRGL